MHPSARYFAPGFFKRSLDEFKRLSSFGVPYVLLRVPSTVNLVQH